MQNNSTHNMVYASTLTIDTALEVGHNYPQDGKCDICLQSLVPTGPVEDTFEPDDAEIVITKVCGDKHHFHRICINAWFHSSTPHLNECPLDRKVLYGTERVPQEPVNLPHFVQFPGHDVDEHEEFYATHPSPDSQDPDDLFYGDGPDEWLDENMVDFFNSEEFRNTIGLPTASREEQIARMADFGARHSYLESEFPYLVSLLEPLSVVERTLLIGMVPRDPSERRLTRAECVYVVAYYGHNFPQIHSEFPNLLNSLGPLSSEERVQLAHMLPAEAEDTTSLHPFRTLPDDDEVPDELEDDHPDVRRWHVQ